MILGSVPLNFSEINSDTELFLLLDNLVVVDSYTDLLLTIQEVSDTILEVSTLTIGSLYIESTTDTGTEVSQHTDNLTVIVLDTGTIVCTETNTYLPGPGNELDFITSVDSFTYTASFIENSVIDILFSSDTTSTIITSIGIDEDVIVEISDYTSTASFIENNLVDVMKMIELQEEFTHADSILCVDSFDANTYVSDPNLIPINNLLPEKFLVIPFYSDLVSVVSNYLVENTHSLVDGLRRMRTPSLFEIFYAESLAGSLGFYQDITSRTESQKRRLIESLTDFYSRNGTVFTFDFISFVTSERFQIIQLYTQDHSTFATAPGGSLVPDGPWYLTNAVDLEYYSTVPLDNAEISKRFYQVAPVPLVLRNVSQSQVFNFTEYESGYVHIELEISTTNGAAI